ncbi:MAG: outer membrane beta-barrel protein [Bacteroidetes bacterium]|nr:outer membrane beta-barrel protein [Bacteroidota bacterium]
MKKNLFLLIVMTFVANFTFSQMSFKESLGIKSKLDFTERKLIIPSNYSSDKKFILKIDENQETTKKWKSLKAKGEESVSGFFIYVSTGYGLNLGSQTINGFTDKTIDTIGFTTENQINVSMGKGLCFKLGGGYMINGNFGFELGATYLLGAKSVSTLDSKTVLVPGSSYLQNTTDITYKPSLFMINPSIIVSAGLEVVNPYAKFGMTIGFASFTREVSTTLTNTILTPGMPDSVITTSNYQKEEFSGSIAVGFNATLGCAFRINEILSFFAEFNMLNMTYSPDKSVITEYTLQGVNSLASLTVKQRQTNFYETLLSTPLTTIPDTSPNQALKQSYAFGSIGLNLGLKINFR